MAGNLGDKKKQRSIFLAGLAGKYPGSTFDGSTGEIIIEKNVDAPFNATMDIDSIRDTNRGVVVTYSFRENRIHIASGSNSVTAVIDQADPSRSKFINTSIPAIKEESTKILADQGVKTTAADTAESAILNDAYQLLNRTNSLSMDDFAADVILRPESQKAALRVAATGYRERHPDDSEGSVLPAKSRIKQAATSPNRPAVVRVPTPFVQYVFFIVVLVGVLWAVFIGIRAMRSPQRDNLQTMQQDRYNSLSPMVTKTLRKMGDSLWGRNWPWAKKYFIYERSTRWLLCNGKEDKNNNIFKAHTRIEVCLRSTYFKIRISRLNKVNVDISLKCKNLSKWELMEGLEKLRINIINANRDDRTVDQAPQGTATIET
jgi:hypothetical protein